MKPVDMNRRHIGLHLCLQPSELIPQSKLCGCIKCNMVGVFLLYLAPGVIDIPFVVSEVDVEDSGLRVDWDWVDDIKSP